MKSVKKYILPTAALLVLSVLYCPSSIAQVTESDILGSWQIDFDALNTSENRNPAFPYDSLTSEGKANLRTAFEGRVFEFADNQEVVITYSVYGKARSVTGQWTLDESVDELTITAQNRQLIYEAEIVSNMLYLQPKTLEPNAAFKQLILKRN